MRRSLLPMYAGHEVRGGRMRAPLDAPRTSEILDPTGHDHGDEDRRTRVGSIEDTLMRHAEVMSRLAEIEREERRAIEETFGDAVESVEVTVLLACPWGGCNGTRPRGGLCNRCGQSGLYDEGRP